MRAGRIRNNSILRTSCDVCVSIMRGEKSIAMGPIKIAELQERKRNGVKMVMIEPIERT